MFQRNAIIAAALITAATGGWTLAGDFSFGLEIGRGGRDLGLAINLGHRPEVVVAEPVAPQPIWVPAVTRTVTEKVWVPTVKTAYRDVPVVDAHGRVVSYRREAYTINSGHYEMVTRQVVVRPGHWAPPTRVAAPATCTVVPRKAGPLPRFRHDDGRRRVEPRHKDRDHKDDRFKSNPRRFKPSDTRRAPVAPRSIQQRQPVNPQKARLASAIQATLRSIVKR